MKRLSQIVFPKKIQEQIGHAKQWWRNKRYKKLAHDEIFSYIYENKVWRSNESVSGPGSESDQTAKLIGRLPSLFNELQIHSMLDIPCGDFNWMRLVDLKNIKYTGGDIVPQLIEHNRQRFQSNNIQFEVIDLSKDSLPKVDLIFCRDCLVHLNFQLIMQCLSNMLQSNAIWLMATTFPDQNLNTDIQTGAWRPLNLCMPPFSFPVPEKIVDENQLTGPNRKSMAVWKIDELKNFRGQLF